MLKEAVMAYFKFPIQHFSRAPDRNHEIPQPKQLILEFGLKPWISHR
jgi:hypothetical protein